MPPSDSATRSPGTSWLAATSFHTPSRMTRALSASRCFKSWMALSALNSCQKPTAALMISIARMMARSSQWRTTAESSAATSIIHGIGPQKKRASRESGLTWLSARTFSPCWASRRAASASLSPVVPASAMPGLSIVSAMGLSWIRPAPPPFGSEADCCLGYRAIRSARGAANCPGEARLSRTESGGGARSLPRTCLCFLAPCSQRINRELG